MKIEYFKEYSNSLQRDMEFKIYGHGGKLCLVIPTQNNRFHEWEWRNMYQTVENEIDQGKITFIACDSIDIETWSNSYGDPDYRFYTHEAWIQYLVTELIPSVNYKLNRSDPWWVIGASIGATHAANLYFRYPDLFDGVFGMSGIYDVNEFFGPYHNEVTYQNNPMAYLYNMPKDHEYISKYNRGQIIFCCGQGAWEEQSSKDLHHFQDVLNEKGIHCWCDYWGNDVCHDWPGWKVQLPYFISHMLNNH